MAQHITSLLDTSFPVLFSPAKRKTNAKLRRTLSPENPSFPRKRSPDQQAPDRSSNFHLPTFPQPVTARLNVRSTPCRCVPREKKKTQVSVVAYTERAQRAYETIVCAFFCMNSHENLFGNLLSSKSETGPTRLTTDQ